MTWITQLTRLSQSFGRYYAGQFSGLTERTGLRMREVNVLLFLANHPEQDTARDVAELRGLSKSQVSQAVEILTQRGMLERRPDEEDRRVVHLAITEAGAPLAKEAQALQAACGGALLEGLRREEVACLWQLLEKLLERTETLTREETK